MKPLLKCMRRSTVLLNRAKFSSTNLRDINRTQVAEIDTYVTKTQILDKQQIANEHRVSILVDIFNSPGSLHHILKYFWDRKIDLTSIESKPSTSNSFAFNVHINFAGRIGEESTDGLLKELRANCRGVRVLDDRIVPWFPRNEGELDVIANKVLEAGVDIESDHPGFSDLDYRDRRGVLASVAKGYRHLDPLPLVVYTEEENNTWRQVYNRLQASQEKYACAEYLNILPLMRDHCGYGPDKIPQARDISKFLEERTGFRLRPVAGLLTSRDFLNALAFKIFFSTQYIRHSSRPFYTPEPDICHELLGHAPMFADPDFASFSQEIGLASLGATDADIKRLATCYWHSVEFGLVKEGTEIKAYGAGLLSSFGELEYACSPPSSLPLNGEAPCSSTSNSSPSPSPSPQLLPWDPEMASRTEYPITSYQPVYFVAESLSDAKTQMRKFCSSLPRPFHACYDPLTSSMWVDRAVQTEAKSA